MPSSSAVGMPQHRASQQQRGVSLSFFCKSLEVVRPESYKILEPRYRGILLASPWLAEVPRRKKKEPALGPCQLQRHCTPPLLEKLNTMVADRSRDGSDDVRVFIDGRCLQATHATKHLTRMYSVHGTWCTPCYACSMPAAYLHHACPPCV